MPFCLVWSEIRPRSRTSRDLTAFRLLFAVEPPSDLKFHILNENTVEMSWVRPSATIEGFKIQVQVPDGGQCVGVLTLQTLWNPSSFLTSCFPPHRWTDQRLYPRCICHYDIDHWPDPWLGLLCVNKLLLWLRGEHPHLWTTDQWVDYVYKHIFQWKTGF